MEDGLASDMPYWDDDRLALRVLDNHIPGCLFFSSLSLSFPHVHGWRAFHRLVDPRRGDPTYHIIAITCQVGRMFLPDDRTDAKRGLCARQYTCGVIRESLDWRQ